MPKFSLVGVAGSVSSPSRTRALVEAAMRAVAVRAGCAPELIDLAEVGPAIMGALTRDRLSAAGQQILERLERADILVVGTPVYRGSYTGALKHLFDLVDQEALRAKPVLLVATGGSLLHGLVTEHQLRPLLSFFGAQTAPTAVYATAQDFTDLTVSSAGTRARLERAAAETVRLAALPRGDRGTDSGDGGHGRAAMAAA